MSDPSGDYLLAIVRSFSPGKVYKIVLVDGEPSGTPVLVQTLNTPTGSPLQAHQFAGTSRARILWEDGLERDVLYVTKDDYVTLPCDAVGIIDATSGEILKVVRAKESGIAVDTSILWPSGVSSNVLNWANPQGIKYHDGRLFIMTRYYWNKGLTQPSCYSYALKAYVNGQEAQGSSRAVIRDGGRSDQAYLRCGITASTPSRSPGLPIPQGLI